MLTVRLVAIISGSNCTTWKQIVYVPPIEDQPVSNQKTHQGEPLDLLGALLQSLRILTVLRIRCRTNGSTPILNLCLRFRITHQWNLSFTVKPVFEYTRYLVMLTRYTFGTFSQK